MYYICIYIYIYIYSERGFQGTGFIQTNIPFGQIYVCPGVTRRFLTLTCSDLRLLIWMVVRGTRTGSLNSACPSTCLCPFLESGHGPWNVLPPAQSTQSESRGF